MYSTPSVKPSASPNSKITQWLLLSVICSVSTATNANQPIVYESSGSSVYSGDSGAVFTLAQLPPASSTTALPTGGEVAAGQVTIQQNGHELDITQASEAAVINWQTYNIGTGSVVDYLMPNAQAISLNRVASGTTEIDGALNANGQVFLVNPNGVYFGYGSQVDVGALVATTLNISDQNFLGGHYQFNHSSNSGNIENDGKIVAHPGGYVALLGDSVNNQGSIQAQLGTVELAAGDKATLVLDQGNLVKIQLEPALLHTFINNGNLIQAEGGSVILSANAAAAANSSVITNSGVIEATRLNNHNGVIELTGDFVSNSVTGSLTANAVTLTANSLAANGKITAENLSFPTGSSDINTARTIASSGGNTSDGTISLSGGSAGISGGNIVLNSGSGNHTITVSGGNSGHGTISISGGGAGAGESGISGGNNNSSTGGNISLQSSSGIANSKPAVSAAPLSSSSLETQNRNLPNAGVITPNWAEPNSTSTGSDQVGVINIENSGINPGAN